MTRLNVSNKYHAKRTWSGLTQRWFDSRAEAVRGEELKLLEKAGEIFDLNYQVKFILSESPKATITIDFAYRLPDRIDLPDYAHPSARVQRVYEDVKGVLTRDFRTKLVWLKQKYGIEVKLIR